MGGRCNPYPAPREAEAGEHLSVLRQVAPTYLHVCYRVGWVEAAHLLVNLPLSETATKQMACLAGLPACQSAAGRQG